MSDSQKDSGVKAHVHCRVCQKDELERFMDLGDQPLANAFLEKDQLQKEERQFPLQAMFCQNCNLVQLGHVVDPELMFQNYVYHSSGMPASKHFRDYAQAVTGEFIHSPGDLVVEIGSNDGHFLEVVKELGARVLGIDPARNIAEIARSRGIPTVVKYFNKSVADEVVTEHGQAKLVVANNVFAHIDDLHSVVKGVRSLLSRDGVFVIEAPYLVDMFENLTFDTIYHEHLSYLAVRPLKVLFENLDMEIFKVETYPIQGVSLRLFVRHESSHGVESSIQELVDKELSLGLDKIESYFELAKRIENLKKEVVDLLLSIKDQGKRIAAYGAPAKGNTLLNYFGLNKNILDYATEGLPAKMGLFTPGTHIPVIDIEESRKNPPDYYLMLAWNYKDGILKKEKTFIEKGGKFIVPVGDERITD